MRSVQVKAIEPDPDAEWIDTDEEVQRVDASMRSKGGGGGTKICRASGTGKTAGGWDLDARKLKVERDIIFYVMNWWPGDGSSPDDEPETLREKACPALEIVTEIKVTAIASRAKEGITTQLIEAMRRSLATTQVNEYKPADQTQRKRAGRKSV